MCLPLQARTEHWIIMIDSTPVIKILFLDIDISRTDGMANDMKLETWHEGGWGIVSISNSKRRCVRMGRQDLSWHLPNTEEGGGALHVVLIRKDCVVLDEIQFYHIYRESHSSTTIKSANKKSAANASSFMLTGWIVQSQTLLRLFFFPRRKDMKNHWANIDFVNGPSSSSFFANWWLRRRRIC